MRRAARKAPRRTGKAEVSQDTVAVLKETPGGPGEDGAAESEKRLDRLGNRDDRTYLPTTDAKMGKTERKG